MEKKKIITSLVTSGKNKSRLAIHTTYDGAAHSCKPYTSTYTLQRTYKTAEITKILENNVDAMRRLDINLF